MMDSADTDFAAIPPAVLLQANEQCDNFEEACKAGQRPSIEKFTADLPVASHPELLREFIVIDCAYRKRRGEEPSFPEYAARFPDIDRNWFERDVLEAVPKTFAEPAPAPALPGTASALQRTFGDYVLLEKIGEGGMGTVYRARHRPMDRIVALKTLSAQFSRHEGSVERFRREIVAAGKLCHPNIVTAYDAGEENGTLYLVMEYIEGSDLGKLVAKQGPLAVQQAASILIQAAAGLGYAHGQGIIHRDVKPANLLIDKRGVVRVPDLGLARVRQVLAEPDKRGTEESTVTTSRHMIGTPNFMAPEQAADARFADQRSDVYSLGCTLYFLLTGKAVFSRNAAVETLLAHRRDAAASLRAARPEIPQGLDEAFQRMVAKNPVDRYAGMNEVIQTLQPFATKTAPNRQWVKAATLGAAAVAAGLLVCVAAPRLFGPPAAPVQPSNASAGPPLAAAPFSAKEAKRLQASWSEHLGLPATKKNSLGMRLALIPPGRFDMGTSAEEAARLKTEVGQDVFARLDSETPRHQVSISRPFYLGVMEVTFEQFERFGKNYTTSAEHPEIAGWGIVNGKLVHGDEFTWKFVGERQPSPDSPVVNLSWSDAVAFCEWLSKEEGEVYRLPTEAEWEYACRGGSDGAWCFGSDAPAKLDLFAWHAERLPLSLVPAKGGLPNAFGLLDMHGNVAEWCLDRYGADYYARSPARDPTGPAEGQLRVFRGGSHRNFRHELRSAARNHEMPHVPIGGFRVVLTIEE
jgi:eukaryotic-like serine/threonine-protein kinase